MIIIRWHVDPKDNAQVHATSISSVFILNYFIHENVWSMVSVALKNTPVQRFRANRHDMIIGQSLYGKLYSVAELNTFQCFSERPIWVIRKRPHNQFFSWHEEITIIQYQLFSAGCFLDDGCATLSRLNAHIRQHWTQSQHNVICRLLSDERIFIVTHVRVQSVLIKYVHCLSSPHLSNLALEVFLEKYCFACSIIDTPRRKKYFIHDMNWTEMLFCRDPNAL
jgi:hypothetical protein